MIRPIDIKLNAAHPELPLVEATTFTGAPSSVFIRGVPKAVGNWSITAVSVAVTYPDNPTTARAAVESAEGVWVATIPGTATSGRTAAGFKIMADGTDENGAAVTGYVLGFADFSVLSFTPVPAPGGTFYLLRYFDQAPATPKKGDVAKINGLYCIYNGTAWDSFGDGPGFSTDDPLMDGEASPGSAETAARSDHVHPSDTSRASTADATLTPIYGGNGEKYSAWSFSDGNTHTVQGPFESEGGGLWSYMLDNSWSQDGYFDTEAEALTATSIPFLIDEAPDIIATRTANPFLGYQLGSQTDKPLASEAEAEALRTGKQDALSAQQLANIAAVPNKANASDIPYILGTPTVISTASSETVEGETVYYGAATLANRTANVVQVTAATALDELRITFPAATNGKVRDFGLRVEIGTGSAALTAPALVPIAPTGETIKIENADGTIPELADGTATAKGVTLLYFSETAPGVFVVKGEQVEEVA